MTDPFDDLAAPARRALASIDVTRLDQLADHTREEIASLHGMGEKAMERLQAALAEQGLSFRGSAG